MTIDLRKEAFFQDPYPDYARMRAQSQPVWMPLNEEYACDGIWLFGRYADAQAIFKQTTSVTKQIRSVRPEAAWTPFDLHMLNSDGEDHLRLRRLVANYFSNGFVNRLEPAIEAAAEYQLRRVLGMEKIDLIADYARPLPLRVILHLMDVPDNDMDQIWQWSMSIGIDSLTVDEESKRARKKATTEFISYIENLMETRKNHRGDDLIAFLRHAENQGKINRCELIAMVLFLLFAGHETTINLIGNGVRLLLSHPDQMYLLQCQPELIQNAIEEILRYESPTQRSTFRIAREPLEISGFRIEPGQQLAAVIGSANRDETVFPHPEVFDIQRSPNPHLAFGFGMHNCLGKTLARLEGKIGLGKILPYLPKMRLSQATPSWRRSSIFRALIALPVVLETV